MLHAPTVTLRFSQAIVQASQRLGVDLPRELILRIRNSPPRVPLSLQDELWQVIATQSDDPLIGLRIGLEIEVGHLDGAGLLLMSCETLGEGLEVLQEYFPIIGEGSRFEIECTSGGKRLRYRPAYESGRSLRAEAVVSCLVRLSRWTTGGAFKPDDVTLGHAPRTAAQAYRDLLGSPIRFEAPDYSVAYPESALSLPLIQANPEMRDHLRTLADEMLAGLSAQGLAAEVEERVRLYPRWGRERLAETLGLSGRHLNRRLAEEGTSFKILRAATLQRMAEQGLRRGERLRELAQALGFADESAFGKAFRRWTGLTPAQYRDRASEDA